MSRELEKKADDAFLALASSAIVFGRVQGEESEPAAEAELKQAALRYFEAVVTMRKAQGLPTPR